MAERVILLQTSFVRGEVSPRMVGRLDAQARADGAALLKNMIVEPYGGVRRRSGTRFSAEVKSSANAVKLIPFVADVAEAYAVEAGPLYLRFYALGGQVVSGGFPVEVVTPYTASDLTGISWAQANDILFLSSASYRPKELQRLTDTSFQLVNFAFNDGPYMDTNETTTTLTLSGTSGSVTVTASSIVGINDGTGFKTTDVNRLIRWKDPANNWTWLEVTAFTDTTHVTATIKGANASAGTATVNWRLGAWSDTTGWPHTVSMHASRIWFGTTTKEKDRRWSSETFDLNSFAPSDPNGTVAADHAITARGLSGMNDHIHWMAGSAQGLLCGGAGAEMLLRAPATTEPLGPANHEVVFQSGWGSDHVGPPVRIGPSILAVDRGGRIIREYAYDFSPDAFASTDLSLFAEHLFQKGIKRIVFQQNPSSTVWALRNDGKLIGMTTQAAQKVLAWHQHDVTGVVEDIAVIPEGSVDRLYMVVNRTINGGTKRYVEYVTDPFEDDTDIKDAFFVDCGISGTFDPPVSAISGLNHLEGQTVSILTDGATHDPKVVVSGQVLLDHAASTITVGLKQQAEIKLLPIQAMLNGPLVTISKAKMAVKAYIQFERTVGATVKMATGKKELVLFRTPDMAMDTAIPLYSGLREVPLPANWALETSISITSDDPLPLSVLLFAVQISSGD